MVIRTRPSSWVVPLGSRSCIRVAGFGRLNIRSFPLCTQEIPVASCPRTALARASELASALACFSVRLCCGSLNPNNPHIDQTSLSAAISSLTYRFRPFKYCISSGQLSCVNASISAGQLNSWMRYSGKEIATRHRFATNCRVAMTVLYFRVPRNTWNSIVSALIRLMQAYRPFAPCFASFKISLPRSL